MQKLSGILSFSDLLLIKEWGGLNNKSKDARNRILLNSNLAKDIMTPNPTTVSPQDTVGLAAEIFMDKNFKCLPVVDSENRVLGVLTTYDLIVLAFTDIHQEIIY
jgi:CBS domain-containing protein